MTNKEAIEAVRVMMKVYEEGYHYFYVDDYDIEAFKTLIETAQKYDMLTGIAGICGE